jgi:hypothetical protein
LFNWLNRESPPPSKKHKQKLVDFLEEDPDYLFFGIVQSVQYNKTDEVHEGVYDDPLNPEVLTKKFQRLLTLADGDRSRLGWINEQLAMHLTPPIHWQTHEERAASLDRSRARAAELMRIHGPVVASPKRSHPKIA